LRDALTCRFLVLPAAWVSGFARLGLTPGFVAGAAADRVTGFAAGLAAGFAAGLVASLATGSLAEGAAGPVTGGAATPAAAWALSFGGGSAAGLVAGFAELSRSSVKFVAAPPRSADSFRIPARILAAWTSAVASVAAAWSAACCTSLAASCFASARAVAASSRASCLISVAGPGQPLEPGQPQAGPVP
jgi:hypothetical protein